jgi:hypothetical protein
MRIASLIVLLAAAPFLFAQTPTQNERDRAMSYLHATRKQFLDTVGPLSSVQWKYKPATGGWSVAEIAEHLAVTEASVFAEIQLSLRAPATPDKKSETAGKDEMIMKGVPDRSGKAQAPESLTPTGRFASRDAAVAEFKARRDQTIAFIEKTPAELRDHMFPHPALKVVDCYQWILFLAAHSDRHIQQMKEVIAEPGFPK